MQEKFCARHALASRRQDDLPVAMTARQVRTRRWSALGALALLATLAPVAMAGTVGAFDIANPSVQPPTAIAPIYALQPNVTYYTPANGKIPANDTQVGFVLGDGNYTVKQVSGNTLNRVTVTFEAWVTDPAETITFRDPGTYLGSLPPACTWDTTNTPSNRKTITCFYRQTRFGDVVLPSFAVFFNAPAKVTNGAFDADNTDFVQTRLTIAYAEGSNDANSVPANSFLVFQDAPNQVSNWVALGTKNQVSIKSAVSKSGARLYTGDGGIPKNQADLKVTELANVPALSGLYTVAQIQIERDQATDPTLGGSNCLSAGNFSECPTYTTTVADPFTGTETRFLGTPLTLVYRIDASNLKRSLNQILSSTLITYTGDKTDPFGNVIGSWVDQQVSQCSSGSVARTDGLPCIASQQCFRNLAATADAYDGATVGRNADLVGDCEWVLVNNGNGSIRFR
jgi:hypothetical protein